MAVLLIAADPNPVVLAGISAFVAGTDIFLRGEYTTLSRLQDGVQEQSPQAILMETRFSDGNGYAAARRIRRAGYQGSLIFFAEQVDAVSRDRAIVAGANSYLLKSVAREKLLRTISLLAIDLTAAPGELERISHLSRWRGESQTTPVLTPRESQVLRHITQGLSNKEIAVALGVCLDTVKEHVANILRKLGASDRTQAAVWAVRNEYILPG